MNSLLAIGAMLGVTLVGIGVYARTPGNVAISTACIGAGVLMLIGASALKVVSLISSRRE